MHEKIGNPDPTTTNPTLLTVKEKGHKTNKKEKAHLFKCASAPLFEMPSIAGVVNKLFCCGQMGDGAAPALFYKNILHDVFEDKFT